MLRVVAAAVVAAPLGAASSSDMVAAMGEALMRETRTTNDKKEPAAQLREDQKMLDVCNQQNHVVRDDEAQKKGKASSFLQRWSSKKKQRVLRATGGDGPMSVVYTGCIQLPESATFHGGSADVDDPVKCGRYCADNSPPLAQQDLPITFRLRGRHGSERVTIKVGRTTKTETIPTSGREYTMVLPASDDEWTVEFHNDSNWPGPTRDVYWTSLSGEVDMSMTFPRLWGGWNCDQPGENLRCNLVRRDGYMLWNGVYKIKVKKEDPKYPEHGHLAMANGGHVCKCLDALSLNYKNAEQCDLVTCKNGENCGGNTAQSTYSVYGWWKCPESKSAEDGAGGF